MSNRPEQVAGYDTLGDTPSAAAGKTLLGDPMTQMSQHRADLVPTPTAAGPGQPPLVVIPGNDEWQPQLVAIGAGQAVEVIGRDALRRTFDITNQSEAVTGSAQTVYLFRSQGEAEHFANDTAAQQATRLQRSVRMVVLPDGAGRTMTHTAAVWAVAMVTGNDLAVLDVSAERRRA